MRAALAAACAMAVCVRPCEAQTWVRSYGVAGKGENFHSAVPAPDGGTLACGYDGNSGFDTENAWIVKTDAEGAVQWQQSYGGAKGDVFYSIQPAPGGGCVVAGQTNSYGPGTPAAPNLWVVRTDSSGGIVWQRTYGGASTDTASALITAADGHYLVMGTTFSYGSGSSDMWLLKLNSSTGDILWQKTYGGAGEEQGSSLEQTSDGGFILGGHGRGGAGFEYWVVKVDSSGVLQWQKEIQGSMEDDRLFSVHQAVDGGYMAAGTYQETVPDDFCTCTCVVCFVSDFRAVKLDASGAVLWDRTYGGAGDDFLRSASLTADGGYVLTGYTDLPDFLGIKAWALKIGASGAIEWQRTFGGAGAQMDASAVYTLPGGGCVLAGYRAGDAALLRLKPDGSLDASCSFTGPTSVSPGNPGGTAAPASAAEISSGSAASPSGASGTDAGEPSAELCHGCTQDAFEPESGCHLAAAIHGGETQRRNFCGDAEDWASFNACAGRIYTIETSALGASADTVLELYGTDCSTLLLSDDDGGGGKASRILNWTAPASGIYHIRVRQADASTGNDRDYSLTLTGDSEPCVAWARGYSDSAAPVAVETSSGNLAFAVQSGSDLALFETDVFGNVLWRKTYAGSNWENPSALRQTPDGGFVVAGFTNSFGSDSYGDAWALKTTATGSIQWQKTYEISFGSEALWVEPSADGGFVLSGRAASSARVWIYKLNASGAPQWQKDYDMFYLGYVRQTKDGGFVMAGQGDFAGYRRLAVIKLDASGNVQWTRKFGGLFDQGALSIEQMPDGGYAVAGYTSSFGAGGDDFWILKLNFLGVPEWQKTLGGALSEQARAIVPTWDGGCAVAGYTASFGAGGDDIWLVKFDSLGEVQWQRTYGGVSTERAFSLRQLASGGFLVAGDGQSFGTGCWALRLDASGGIGPSVCPLIQSTNVAPQSSVASITYDTAAPVNATPAAADTTVSPVPSGGAATEQCSWADPYAILPSEVSPPLSTQPLLLSAAGVLSWENGAASGSITFNVHKGNISDLAPGNYGACLQSGIGTESYEDMTPVPPGGAAWFYLVTGVNAVGEGPSGQDSSGVWRPLGPPCP
jgi:hypothetical protein